MSMEGQYRHDEMNTQQSEPALDNDGPIQPEDGVDIQPGDSVSQAGSSKSSSRLSKLSSVSSVQKAMVREIELAAEAEMVKKRNEIRQKKRSLMRKLDEEVAKQEIEETTRRLQEELRLSEQHAARLKLEYELKDEEEKLADMEAEMDVLSRYKVAQSTTKILKDYSADYSTVMTNIELKKSLSLPIISDTGDHLDVKPKIYESITSYQPHNVTATQSAATKEINPKIDEPSSSYQPHNITATESPATKETKHSEPVSNEPKLQQKSATAGTTIANELAQVLDKLVDQQRESALPTSELDTFDGSDLLKFGTFMRNFKFVVEEKTEDPVRRLELLLKYTKGQAKELISQCPMIDPPNQGYERAIKLLKREYGQTATLAAAYISKAESWPRVPLGDKEALRKFSVFITNCCSAKISNQHMITLDNYDFLRQLVCKLPLAVQQKWVHKVGNFRDQDKSPTLEDLEEFVGKLSRDENDPRIAGLGYQGRRNNETNRNFQRKSDTNHANRPTRVFATTVASKSTNSSNKAPCLHCGQGTKHSILECRKFGSLSAQERSQICKTQRLCFGCLNSGHMKKDCKKILKCSKCNKSHPTILHDPNWKKPEMKDYKTVNEAANVVTGCVGVRNEVCARTGTNKTIAPLMTVVPVIVKAKSSDNGIYTYAFVDNGSGAVFADTELSDKLHARTRKTELFLKTLNSQETLQTHVITDKLQIGDADGNTFLDLPEVYLQDQIPISKSNIPVQEDLKRFKHLSAIKLPKLPVVPSVNCIPRVTILIGINVPAATIPLETKAGEVGQPYAIKSPLGWLVYGLPGKNAGIPSHFCQISSVTNVQEANDRLEAQVKAYINMEFNEKLSDTTLNPSKEDRQFLKMMDEGVEFKDGHFELPLPFRNVPVQMPNNVSQAYQYANHLRKKLVKDKDLKEEYQTFMEKLESKGYAEKVPENELERKDKVWYIPHHAVRHPQKQSIRVVFNCPAIFQGRSLNNELLQGPDLINRLHGILLRWRTEDIAISADIESMFYQVRVPEEDRDMLRFLWWTHGDLSKDPDVYRMKVHVFGSVSSPSCANYALKKCAADAKDQETKDAIQKDFYVDDLVKSVETTEKAVKLVHDLKTVLAGRGFNLTKWISNDREVIDTISPHDRAEGVKDLDVDTDLPNQRTLGVQWNVEDDTIGFHVQDISTTATRRNVLSTISQVYDPIGIASAFTLNAKKILQASCKQKIGWDEQVPPEQQHQWQNWCKDLPRLGEVKIPRCYKPRNFGSITNRQIHHFADASQDGYGCVSYLRLTNENDEIHTAFVMGKSRVAPIKPHTIVKMELAAATTAVKQDTMLKKEFINMPIDSTTFWTDSQTVLKYIANPHSRYNVFVANRIAIITDGSDTHQWKYIPSELNPADHASRGLKVSELTSKSEWLKGPTFLRTSEENWPKPCEIPPSEFKNQENLNEVPANVVSTSEETDTVDRLLSYYSDWQRLTRAVAWWLKFKAYLQRRRNKSETIQHGPTMLSLNEIKEAELTIIQYVQQRSYPDEIKVLKKRNLAKEDITDADRFVHGRSQIASLDPELQDGLLVVGGRLRNARIPHNAKHQMILPKDHNISKLIVRSVHKRLNHQGRNHVLAELRQKYWIVGARVLVKSVISKCVACKKYQSRPGKQKMADLPASRLVPDEPPFHRSGVDYFGPFEIRQGRTVRKRYGVIFTCFNTRAVHIEVAESMDTSSCIDAIRRFTARRGNVKQLFSDNGSNLVSANKELKQSLQELNQQQISDHMSVNNIEWHFNPPSASHFGGVWERQIRTIRKILCALLNEQHVKSYKNEEQLRTFMCEVEATINSRPLTRVSDDPNDLDVIRPQDLLLLNHTAAFPPGVFDKKDNYVRRRWRQNQYLADIFWKRWTKEYLPELQKRQKWIRPNRNIQTGDVVLIVDDQAPRNSWPLGLIKETHKDKNGLVRSVKVKTKTTILIRPVNKLCLILECEN